jgi:hypothetical protein
MEYCVFGKIGIKGRTWIVRTWIIERMENN